MSMVQALNQPRQEPTEVDMLLLWSVLGLLLKEPDFGAFVVIISIAIGILFLGGMRARLFAVLFVVLLAAFTAFAFAIYPAWVAAGLKPADALRAE